MKNKKEIELPNSNIYLLGRGLDVNGNVLVKLKYPNSIGFSFQSNNDGLMKTAHILRSVDTAKELSAISKDDLLKIEKQLIEYIEKNGSKKQKEGLRVYSSYKEKYNDGGGIETKRTELQEQISKAKRQLQAAEKNNAPAKFIEGGKNKIDRLEKELAELTETKEEVKVETPKEEEKTETPKKAKPKYKKGDYVDYNVPLLKGVKSIGQIVKVLPTDVGVIVARYTIDTFFKGKNQVHQVNELDINKKVKEPAKEKAEKIETPKVESVTKTKDSDFDITEKDGATLVASTINRNWVMTIEKKGDKFHVSCCSEDYKHPDFDSKEKAVEYSKKWLHCKNIFNQAKERAVKRHSAKSVAKAKKLTTDVTATTDKAKDAVVNKVEKIKDSGKDISTSDIKDVTSDIKAIVHSIVTAIENMKERKAFLEGLKKEIDKELSKY